MYRKLVSLFLGLFSFASISLQADLPYPYNTLETVLPYHMSSFYANEIPMEKLLSKLRRKPIVVVELGSWYGASTIHIARLLAPGSKVYAVDHWIGSSEHQSGDYAQFLPNLYEQFLSNVIHAGQTDKIIPLRMTTREAAHVLNISPDVIYVDASHDEMSVYIDLCDWFPFVKGHGVMCGDDWGWGDDRPVQKAVKRFAAENNLSIEVAANNWFWVLRER